VVTIPTGSIPWLKRARSASIPVGSNIPPATAPMDGRSGGPFTVAVFGVTAGNMEEATEIAQVVNGVQDVIGRTRLLVMGRGAVEAEPVLKGLIRNTDAAIAVTDVMSAEAIRSELGRAHALLFLRGPLSSRRGSAVAALAQGLPVVGFEGDETGPPMTEAGVSLVKQGDSAGLVGALVRLAQDPDWWAAQRERSTRAYDRHFRWDRIAQRFEELLLSSA
jgi:glycosyltransferase involved in cell wall biosynthesis